MSDFVDVNVLEERGILGQREFPVLPLSVTRKQQLLTAGLEEENDAGVVQSIVHASHDAEQLSGAHRPESADKPAVLDRYLAQRSI